MKTETLETIGAAGNKLTITGGALAVAGKWTATDIAAYVGAAVAIIGLLITWYYKREANKRTARYYAMKERESELRIEMMRSTGRPVFQQDTDLGQLVADE
jgi:hypothetical protein